METYVNMQLYNYSDVILDVSATVVGYKISVVKCCSCHNVHVI